jgi:hypothetical protein
MSARPGLYGGQPVMVVPTVINSYPVVGTRIVSAMGTLR